MGVRLAYLLQEHNQLTEDMKASNARLHEAQEDFKGMLRTLARQVESFQGGGLPQSEISASAVVDVDDLKNKVTRLMEQVEHHTRSVNTLAPLREKIDINESQLQWQHRLPRRLLGEDLEEIQSSIELEEFQ